MADNVNLGNIISNDLARKVIYGVYVVAVVIAGALQVWYSSTTGEVPSWLSGTLDVLAYLGIPVGTLALANTSSNPSGISDRPINLDGN